VPGCSLPVRRSPGGAEREPAGSTRALRDQTVPQQGAGGTQPLAEVQKVRLGTRRTLSDLDKNLGLARRQRHLGHRV